MSGNLVDERLAEAWLNNRHTVLGVRLRGFSLWHAFLLQVVGHPMAIGGRGPVTFAALLMAADICRCAPMEIPAWGGRARWRTRLRARWAWLRWGCRSASLQAELQKMRVYLRDYATEAVPEFYERADGERGRSVETPAVFYRMCQLVRLAGMSVKEAWDTPYGAAVWLAAGLAEVDGADLNMVTDEMRAALREAGWPGAGEDGGEAEDDGGGGETA